jgi:uncharacterized protein (TIGR03437 family)
MDFFRSRVTLLIVLLAFSAPAFAQLVANPSPVVFNYAPGTPVPAQTVAITATSGTPNVNNVIITSNVQCTGNSCMNVSGTNVSGLFLANGGGTSVNVGFEPNVLGTVASQGLRQWLGQITVQAPGYADLTVQLQLNITSGGSISVSWQGAAVPSTGVVINGGIGTIVSTTVTLSSTTTAGFSLSSNQSWLTVSPQTGTVGPAASPQQAVITLTANATGLPIGANNATVNVLANGVVAASFVVTFNVGTSSGITLSPNPMNFQFITTTSSYIPGQTQFLTISGSASSATFNAQSNASWLLVNGGLTVTGQSVLQSLSVSVNVAALNAQIGTYSGTVTVTTSDNRTATLQVVLTISTTSSGNTGNLTFNVATPGGAAPPSQTISISGSGQFTAFANTSTCGTGWLSVTPTSGVLTSATTVLTVSVFPGILGAGTCTGNITISTTGLLQNNSTLMTVGVTMTIGGSTTTGAVASPSSLVFNLPPNATQQQTFIVNGDGSAFTAQVFGLGNAISISPTSAMTPAVVTVTANTSGLNVGSNPVGTITVTSSLGTQTMSVTINVLTGLVLESNPASLSFIYQSGNVATVNLGINSSGDPTNPLTFTVSSAPSFISYSANGTTTPTVIGVGVNTSRLGPGFNTGTLVLSSNSAANPTLNIPITVLAPGTTPGLTATPNPVTLTGQAFGAPVSTTLSISGLTGTTFTASTNSAGNWLSVTPNSGTSPATLTVTGSPTNLSTNTYTGTITLTASNGSTVNITVTFNVGTTAPPTTTLAVSPNTLTFNYKQGDPAPAAQPVQISTNGASASFTVSTNVNWITLSQTSGTSPSTLNISVDPTRVPLGTNTGTVTVTSTGATNSPQTITVTANVTSPPVLAVSASTTDFTYRTGDPNPASQTVQVTSSGAALSFTISVSNAPWLTVTPTSGTTPATLTLAVTPGTLNVGNYSATVTITATGSTQTVTVNLVVSAPLPTVDQVLNAASNLAGPIAPGEIITIKGSAMGSDPLTKYVLNGDVFANNLSNTQVLVGGFPSPMVYASSTQVSAIVPYAIAGRTSTFVQVSYLGQRSNSVTVAVAATAPGMFTLNATGTGPGAIFNGDGSLNSDSNPSFVGDIIQTFNTGEGQTIPPGVDGKLADSTPLPKPVLPVTGTISGLNADVTYAGAAPGLVAGLMQVNLRVPAGAKSGDVQISVGGNKSQSGVTVAIK